MNSSSVLVWHGCGKFCLDKRWGCTCGGLGFAGNAVSGAWPHQQTLAHQTCSPVGLMGIGFPKLGFWFGVQAVPGHLGVAHSELKLSKSEAFGRGGLVPGASHYLSSTTPRIIDAQAS